MTSAMTHVYAIVIVSILHLIVAQDTCEPGEFRFRGSCIKCRRNTYTALANQTRCTPCPVGTVSRKGSAAFERCKPCPRGTFLDESIKRPVCRRCPLNTFTDQVGLKKCTPCPEGTISQERGKSIRTCITCPIGPFVKRTSFRPFKPSCEQCEPGQGTFAINSEECKNCPKGMFSNPSVIGCKKCRPGTFANETHLRNCHDCPVDMFASEEGSLKCKKCPEGSSTKGRIGALRCKPDCVGGHGCNIKSCPRGFELNRSAGKCRKCPPMHVNNARSTTPCAQCQMGGEAMANDARTRCICMPGYSKSINGLCRPCPENTSNNDGGACRCRLSKQFEGKCRCPPLTTQVGFKCVPCNPRLDPFCDNCRAPEFFNRTSNRCEKCPKNTFRGFDDFKCRRCPGDSISTAGAFSCDCGAGRGIVNGKCDLCPPGSFNSPRISFRRVECQKCSTGEFQDEFGATKCKRCAKGVRPTEFGATKCLDECPPNSRRTEFNAVCRCRSGFTNNGTRDEPVCVPRT